jgi:hypothetical protein
MPTPVPSCAVLFRGGELLSFARRCDRQANHLEQPPR